MTPTPMIRLQSVVHTLEQVVIPAVDTTNSLAMEQCGLVLAQLRMLVAHMPFIGGYHQLCLTDLVATADGLPAPEGGADSQAAAAAVAQARKAADEATDPAVAFHTLGHAIEELLRACARDGDPAYRAAVDAAVLAFSIRQSRRSRSWFRDAGFDHNPAELPELADMVAGEQE